MKNIFKILFGVLAVSVAIFSCKKDENKIYFEGGTNPVLSASSTLPMVLDINSKNAFAIKFLWTNPDYQFTTGISSQDVTYTLQFDTAGANFTSPGKQERAISKALDVSFTVQELNSFLSRMELKDGVAYNMEVRVKSSLNNGSLPLYSNALQIKITPYLDFAVEPPGTLANNYNDGNLWVIGDCFGLPNWANPLPSPQDVTHKFTKVDKLHYELIIDFVSGGGYKMIQTQGVWATQYHAMVANTALSGEFEKRDGDPQFASPGAGKYKVAINFQTGKYTLTNQ